MRQLHSGRFPVHSDRFFVITGGPGSGKTSLAEALQRTGLGVAPEAGRAVIRAQRAIGGPAGHDGDRLLFAELMLGWELRSYEMAHAAGGIHFFDRGVPDLLGYMRLIGQPAPPHMQRAAELFRYNKKVFVAPPWPDIYVQDSERNQSLEEAEKTYEAVCAAYCDAGYTLLHLPRASVEERRDFVLTAVEQDERRDAAIATPSSFTPPPGAPFRGRARASTGSVQARSPHRPQRP